MVLLPEIADARDAAFTAEKILAAMASPFAISGHDHHLSGCIGISVYPEDGHTAGALIKSADTAMYQGKAKGHGNSSFSMRSLTSRMSSGSSWHETWHSFQTGSTPYSNSHGPRSVKSGLERISLTLPQGQKRARPPAMSTIDLPREPY